MHLPFEYERMIYVMIGLVNMNTTIYIEVLLVLLLSGFLHLETIRFSSCNSEYVNMTCIETERTALLNFKTDLKDPSGRLSSWVGKDCCNWIGVGCHKVTGHVVKLDLRNPCHVQIQDRFNMDEADLKACDQWSLRGKLSPSLLDLKHLNYLDLSLNNFGGTRIPEFMGWLSNLKYLNLSCSSFSETIPTQLGNLSNLFYLDLYVYSYSGWKPELKVENLSWLAGLSSLKYLNMGFVNLSKVVNWLQEVNKLPALLELHLPYCQIHHLPEFPLSSVNFTSLAVLDLSNNDINSSIPQWLFNLTRLIDLDLGYNSLQGPIPDSFANLASLDNLDLSHNGNIGGEIPRTLASLCNLKKLDLSWNNMSGEIVQFVDNLSAGCVNSSSLQILNLQENQFSWHLPESVGKLSSLKDIVLSNNQMKGTIPKSIGKLSELVVLDLSENSWEDVITEAHFENLTKLEQLWILTSPGSLALNVGSDWIPPFKLKYLDLGNCHLRPEFPQWLRYQEDLFDLYVNNNGISDTIPDWFWNLSSRFDYFDLSKNQLSGRLPNFLEFHWTSGIDLSSNRLEGPVPIWFSETLANLLLGNNYLSGPIPTEIGSTMPRLMYLDLSRNSLSGVIPSSMQNLSNLGALTLSDNHLSGELPAYWNDLQGLWFVDLSNNSFSGIIPTSVGFLSSLISLKLNNNKLAGELPSSLQNCTQLFTLDLGENNLQGNFPTWLGESLSSLLILRVRSNQFTGIIPPQLCHLSTLHILDLANNSFHGTIPPCFGNLTALTVRISEFAPAIVPWYDEHIDLVVKGRALEFSSTRLLVKSIDLSDNNLNGDIPEELTSLLGIGTLNLSMNHLEGKIPSEIGSLRWLETLDLSSNQLSGPIPYTIVSLTSLSHFNLSHNKLSGRIPTGYQLETFDDPSIYEGNPELCGPPLRTKCPGNESSRDPTLATTDETKQDETWLEMKWFYVSLLVGLVIGFWSFCGAFFFMKTWRVSYLLFLDDILECFNVSIVRTKAQPGKESSVGK